MALFMSVCREGMQSIAPSLLQQFSYRIISIRWKMHYANTGSFWNVGKLISKWGCVLVNQAMWFLWRVIALQVGEIQNKQFKKIFLEINNIIFYIALPIKRSGIKIILMIYTTDTAHHVYVMPSTTLMVSHFYTHSEINIP